MPLWSQGFKVCIHPPLTDEARIPLEAGDLVNVTRWRKHWLFGEKIEEDIEIVVNNGKNGKKQSEADEALKAKKRTRGWFPRQCAAEFFEDNDVSDAEFEEESKMKKKKK
jgi:palmitoyltransferase ZDHHC6